MKNKDDDVMLPCFESPQDVLKYTAREQEWRQFTIRQLTREMIPLRRMQNAATPVNRLPPEIFAEIFSYLIDYNSKRGTLRYLILSTHVCSHWRQIALNAASLWTTFSIYNIPAAEVFMKRSRNCPLSLFLTTSRPTNYIIKLITSCVHRLRSLHLSTGDPINMQRILTRVPLNGAPLLETLSLTVQNGDTGDYDGSLDSAPLFGGNLPMLRTLILFDTSLNISFSKPCLITCLDICYDNVEPNDMLETLENCPVLETFRCRGFVDFEMEDLPDDHIIALPHLTFLSLGIGNSFQAVQLLSHISIPQNCILEYQSWVAGTHEYSTEDWGYSTMLPVQADTNLRCFSSIRRLELHHIKCLQTLKVLASHDAEVGTEEPPIRLYINSPFLETFYGNWPFDVTHVETLVLSDMDYQKMRQSRWRSMLQSVPALKTLRILSLSAVNAYGLLDTLRQDDPDAGSAQSFAVCPELSSLELYDVEAFLSLWWKIHELLLARCRHGNLREVDFFNVGSVNAESAWAAKLEECLPELTIRFE